MTESADLHLHLPTGFQGVIHLHFGEGASGPAVAAGAAPALGERQPDGLANAGIEEMLGRFETFDAATAARRIYEEMITVGWEPFLPQPRGGKEKSEAAYIRLVYRGTARRVSLYLNSAVLTSSGTRERDFVSQLPGAEPQRDDVVLHHSDGRHERALEAVKRLRQWADGITDATR